MKGYDDLILCVDLGSSGQERLGAREMPNPALRGSIHPGLGSEMTNTLCVIHLDTRLGLRRVGVARATAAAGLRGEARRRRALGPCQCRAVGAKGAGSTRKARHTLWCALQG